MGVWSSTLAVCLLSGDRFCWATPLAKWQPPWLAQRVHSIPQPRLARRPRAVPQRVLRHPAPGPPRGPPRRSAVKVRQGHQWLLHAVQHRHRCGIRAQHAPPSVQKGGHTRL